LKRRIGTRAFQINRYGTKLIFLRLDPIQQEIIGFANMSLVGVSTETVLFQNVDRIVYPIRCKQKFSVTLLAAEVELAAIAPGLPGPFEVQTGTYKLQSIAALNCTIARSLALFVGGEKG
jgi:hypothetical protein